MTRITNVQFEHYHPPNTIGVEETRPRISWQFRDYPPSFQQDAFEIEVSEVAWNSQVTVLSSTRQSSPSSYLVPWPHSQPLISRQQVSIRVRAWDPDGHDTEWSEPASLEVGLLNPSDWQCERIAAPWGPGTSKPDTEQLYRREFKLADSFVKARLYITAQGVYEAEINGRRVGDHFLAPGWTTYDGRLQYQTYDITDYLSTGDNCIGVRVAEGWFSGRIGFEGGHRNIWGSHPALLVQLEVTLKDGGLQIITSDGSWSVTRGPIRLAGIDSFLIICN